MKKSIYTCKTAVHFNPGHKGAPYTVDGIHYFNDGNRHEAVVSEWAGYGFSYDNDHIPFDKGSDIEELNASVKSSGASLACLYGDPAMTQLSDRKRQELKIALLNELTELERAFDLLDTTDHPDLRGVLSNILYEGLPRQVERVLFGSDSCDCSQKGKSKKRRHSRRSDRKGERM